MNSFNVYGQKSETIGGNTPVWIGNVKPIPRGGTVEAGTGEFYQAGAAVKYNAETREVEIFTDVLGAADVEVDGYLYNDICIEDNMSSVNATCAVVMHHPEGLLIERVYPGITEEQIQALQAKVPGVLLVRG
mgnify:CR=1 FL=1